VGGAIRGIGEKFATKPDTGTGSTSAPLLSVLAVQFAVLNYSFKITQEPATARSALVGNNPCMSSRTNRDKGFLQYIDDCESNVFVLSDFKDQDPVLGKNGNRFPQKLRNYYRI
jgi:hypothetical protein